MRATLEQPQPKEDALLTYQVLNKIQNADEACINAAIEHTMDENGFFKSPFEADLKIYYRYALNEGLNKKNKRIQVLVLDNKTNACLWKGETSYLPKKLTNEDILAYTYLLMKRFEWENDRSTLLVKN
jgi:hypothetical protein